MSGDIGISAPLEDQAQAGAGLPALCLRNALATPPAGDELRVDTDDESIVLRRSGSLAERRLRTLDQVAGSLADVYEPGYLDQLRDEWR